MNPSMTIKDKDFRDRLHEITTEIISIAKETSNRTYHQNVLMEDYLKSNTDETNDPNDDTDKIKQSTSTQCELEITGNTLTNINHFLYRFRKYSIFNIHCHFSRYVDENKKLSKNMYREAMMLLLFPQEVLPIISRFEILEIFNYFDVIFDKYNEYLGSGGIYLVDLVSGLSCVCGGTFDEKVDFVLSIYETPSSKVTNHIQFNDMVIYLSNVFKMLYIKDSSMEKNLGVNSYELTSLSGDMILEIADNLDVPKSIFKKWFYDNYYQKMYTTNYNLDNAERASQYATNIAFSAVYAIDEVIKKTQKVCSQLENSRDDFERWESHCAEYFAYT